MGSTTRCCTGLMVLGALHGCVATSTVVRHGHDPPEQDTLLSRRRRPDEGSPIEATWRIEGPTIHGELHWSERCRTGLVQQNLVYQQEVSRPETSSNAFWMLGGAGMVVGGGALVASSWGGSTSQKASTVPPALALLVTGALTGLGALRAQLKGPVEGYRSQRAESTDSLPGGALITCGVESDLSEIKLGFALDDETASPTKIDKAQLGLVVNRALSSTSKGRLVAMSTWREVGGSPGSSLGSPPRAILEPGDVLAEVDLASIARFQTAPSTMRFSGAFLGNASPQPRECKEKRRPAEICNGVDDDCDGFWDIACGVRPGALQWTLTPLSHASLTLAVTEPSGITVTSELAAQKGSTLEIQELCPADASARGTCIPMQNVFLPFSSTPREGTYVAEVFPSRDGSSRASGTLRGTLSIHVAGRGYQTSISLDQRRGWSSVIVFALGDDRDGDAVIDGEDACPDTPGAWERGVSRRGCPTQEAATKPKKPR